MSALETSHQASQSRPLSPQRISEMAWGFAPPLILEAAIRNKVFDELDSGPKTIDELSAATKTSPRGLRAILNALVGFDLLMRNGDRYALTEESAAFLVSTKPSFQGGIYRHISSQLIPAWLDIEQIVRTGKADRPVNQQESGAEFFAQFVEDILPMSYNAAQALADTVADQLKPAEGALQVKVLDIASGSGVWGIALAQKSPSVHVTAVDWPQVTPITRKIAGRFGVGDRFHTVDGDLLAVDFGTGHRVATLGHILHSEGEARSRTLLKKVFDALAPGGTIAIAEFVPNDDRTGPPAPLIFAVNMLVNTELGDTFTFSEISDWLKEAGFEKPRQQDAPSVSPLILANKPRSG
jgi:3-hydroxy-5-methyl-1-naphthoate 3-O-methyltransferase